MYFLRKQLSKIHDFGRLRSSPGDGDDEVEASPPKVRRLCKEFMHHGSEYEVENMDDEPPPFIRRRQAFRRKGYVWEKATAFSRLSEEKRNPPRPVDKNVRRSRGSSVDLAASLISIYDSLASGGKKLQNNCDDQTVPNCVSSKLSTNQNHSLHLPPEIRIDVDSSEREIVAGGRMASTSCDNHELVNDNKKRPLSISSMSSSSSSSLPRHVHKKPNLTEYDPGGVENMDKIDNLLFIDDDTPSGVTDEEMSVDADGSKKGQSSTAESDGDSAGSLQDKKDIHSKTLNHSEDQCTGVSQLTPSLSDSRQSDLDISVTSGYNSYNASFSSPGYMSQNDISVSSPSQFNTSGKSPMVNGTPVRHPSVKDGSGSPKYVTHVQRVVAEIKETERIYVQCLSEIIEGYLNYLVNSPHLKISSGDRDCLFGNIQEIYEFSRQFTEDLEKCEDDPVKVAECFVAHNEGFSIYAQYCTNYPTAVEVLTKVMMDPELSDVFKQQQIKLGHNLPLGAYLLKPVQRVLKYHLLLHNILKNYDKKDPGYPTMSRALDHMTGMAHHINEMKRKHEHAVRVQEIQSQLEDYEGEDLTRLGELVLEGSFRVYGAKTSRHVFLFEKGVLVSKRKEDGMQSCKGFILCSNLMLVESIPKEPLTFQIIPFDNPKGQHTLQARNLEQKRKWCQEIKTLILESYKEKIPEKVKGLVMQLGKSKDEDSVKGEEGKKIHHHTAPEYLERRHRLRRKSGGTLLPDLLKPNRLRKGQRRAESVSPRSTPPAERKYMVNIGNRSTLEKKQDAKKNQELSRVSTDSDLYSWKQNVNHESSPTVNQDLPVNRSKSFRIAVKGNPRASGDYAQIDEPKEVRPVASVPTRRSQSFRQATRMKPLLSVDYENPEQMHPSLSSPDTSLSLQEINNLEGLNKECNNQYLANRISGHDSVFSNGSVHDANKSSDVSQRELAGRYSSLPVLSNANNENRNSHSPSSSSSSSRTFSTGSFKTLNSPSQCKRVIDTKQYFSVNKDGVQEMPKYRDQDSCNNNFRREGKSVSAFNDSFLKKSTENLMAKSPKYSQKLGPRSITLTKPLSFTVLKYSSDPIHVSKKGNSDNKENVINGDFIKCDNEEEDDPWVPNPSFSSVENLIQSPKPQPRQRAYSADGEIDDFSEENFDWLVYANRNHIPVTGFSSENIPKLYKYCTPPRDSMEPPPADTNNTSTMSQNGVNKPYKTPRLSLIKTYATPPRSAMDPRQMQDYSGVKNHAQLDSLGSSSESEEKSSVGSLPMVGKPADHHILEERRQVLLKRSMSTPCARHHSFSEAHRRATRPVSVEIDYIDDDHEKIVAEMEDYMRRSDSNMTLNSSKFPMNIAQVTEHEKNADQGNRDSCMSYLSSSSYESQGSYSNHSGGDNVVGTIKNKLHDIKQKLTHRRSGSYDNKCSNMSDPEYDSEGEKNRHKSRESGSSLMSLNTWFGGKSKEQNKPDLQSVLLAGELGSASVGQRIAEQEPDYADLNDSLQKIRSHSQHSVDDVNNKSKNSTPVKIEQNHIPSLQNLNIQQCDSAFSIQSDIGDLTSEESPRDNESVSKPKGLQRSESCSSAESFYERRFSVAFDEGEVFRDSAVYCEMDIDQPVASTQELPPKAPRVPIKEYVQLLEEKTKPKESQTKKVKHREPAAIIRQRMESLKSRLEGPSTYSRPSSEERRFLRFHSRPVSEERELTPFNFNISRSNRSSSTSVNILSHQGKDEENGFHEYPDNRRLYRSRSNPPAGGPLRASRSLGRLDQLSNDLDNLVIMKGWVKQLISRFQSNQ